MKTSKKELLSRFLPVLIWVLVIFAFSSNPKPYASLPNSWSEPINPANPAGLSADELLGRILHTAEYLVLSLLIARALIWKASPRLGIVLGAGILGVLYALSDEIHQLFVPGRAFQLNDLLLDSIGVILGVAVFLGFKRLRDRSNLKV